jgi:hypothetical protein
MFLHAYGDDDEIDVGVGRYVGGRAVSFYGGAELVVVD